MNYFTISPYQHKAKKLQNTFPHLTLHIKVELQGSSSQWAERDVKGGGHDFIDCIALEFAWRERLTTVRLLMNIRVPWNAGNFLTSCKPVSFSRRTLHRGVSKEVFSECNPEALLLEPIAGLRSTDSSSRQVIVKPGILSYYCQLNVHSWQSSEKRPLNCSHSEILYFRLS